MRSSAPTSLTSARLTTASAVALANTETTPVPFSSSTHRLTFIPAASGCTNPTYNLHRIQQSAVKHLLPLQRLAGQYPWYHRYNNYYCNNPLYAYRHHGTTSHVTPPPRQLLDNQWKLNGIIGHNKKIRAVSNSSRSRWQAKFKVDIVTLGKKTSKDATFDDPIAEYVRRLRGTMDIRERSVKRDMAARTLSDIRANNHSVLVLDAGGLLPASSEHFADVVFRALSAGSCHVSFFIGDAEGFPKDMRALMPNVGNVQRVGGSDGHRRRSGYDGGNNKYLDGTGTGTGGRQQQQQQQQQQAVQLLSLSTLTLTHKMVRLLLYEQLYRAVEIRNNTKYHK